ncbi:MAG TPA: GAF domain-containing protein [Burkholderiales bacterium]|nr:GAF domain-containing protein [Burkholderiales bacterium]
MASPVMAFAQLANECEAEGLAPKNAEKIGKELANTFGVKTDEVAVLKVEKQSLTFAYPTKLGHIGTIPVNASSSVAGRTATTKRAEIINNFAQTKHASVFESVNLGGKKEVILGAEKGESQHVIQKLMSVPVVTPAGVVGVIQVSRKGSSAPSAGADFTPADLQKLVTIATSLGKVFK